MLRKMVTSFLFLATLNFLYGSLVDTYTYVGYSEIWGMFMVVKTGKAGVIQLSFLKNLFQISLKEYVKTFT